MSDKEATARIKINKLLEAAGWRFFAEGNKPANIHLESRVTLKTSDLEDLGDNFEKTSKGFIDSPLTLNTRSDWRTLSEFLILRRCGSVHSVPVFTCTER